MLAKMCGWNEPEQVKLDHVHLQVDSALIEQASRRLRSDERQTHRGAKAAAGGQRGGAQDESERRNLDSRGEAGLLPELTLSL
jgi:hypothetical protein